MTSTSSNDWRGALFGRSRDHLVQGLGFLLAPRRYLRSIESDRPSDVWARVAVLAVAFAAVELLLFRRSLDVPTILWLGLLESALGLLAIPTFYAVVRTLGGRHPLRVATVYVLTARFTLIVPAVVLYQLFLMTEDYSFALLRGVAVVAYVIAFLTILPFTYFDRLRQRLLALAIGVTVFITYSTVLSSVVDRFRASGSRIAELSLLYDPIGAEVDRLGYDNDSLDAGPSLPPEFRRAADLALSGVADSTGQYVYFRSDSMLALARDWRRNAPMYHREWESIHDRLAVGADSASFETTKQFIARRQAHLLAVYEMGALLDDYATGPRASLHSRMIEGHIKVQRTLGDRLQWTVENLQTRRRIAELGLISYGPWD